MNDSMQPRSRHHLSGYALFGTLALAVVAGCGGLASSRESGDPQASDPQASDDASNEAPEEVPEEMPPLFDVLELRQLSDPPDQEGSVYRCEYATRIKVNLVTGHFIDGACVSDPNGGLVAARSNALLTPAQLAAVQDAYRQVRSSTADRCTSGADILTLALEIDRETSRQQLLFADDDHAACPVPGVQSTSFVTGLSALYARLEQLRGR